MSSKTLTIKNRLIRKINQDKKRNIVTYGMSVPKELVEEGKLEEGQMYDIQIILSHKRGHKSNE